MSDPKHKAPPTSRLRRLGDLARVGLRTGAAAIAGSQTSAAEHARDVLGNLRGLATKLGQMASYVDGVVPEEQRAAFETALTTLRAQAPRSPPAEMRKTMEEAWGKRAEELFTDWTDEPVASASIGQVYRATLRDNGRIVAIKVQHARIHEALESDLANAGVLRAIVGAAAGRRFNSKELFDIARERFREELDYALEARRIDAFVAMHEGDPQIRIPRVVHALSSQRVLVTDWASGVDFDAACAAPEAARRAWAETMWRFVFKGNLKQGLFNADPHPGNYIFHDDGVVSFLDFGCVQEIKPEARAQANVAHAAAMRGDRAGFRSAMRTLLGIPTGSLGDAAVAYSERCFDPLFMSPFHITRAYATEVVSLFKDLAKDARAVDEREFFNMPPHMLFMNRLQFGFYSVLARLDVSVDYAAVERGFLEG